MNAETPMSPSRNALGFAKPAAETRVVVAMSGGVDSSVTAGLLAEQGFEVIGVTLQLYDHGAPVAGGRSCCAGEDIYDARSAADALGIPHYVLDYQERFRTEVMESFAESYARGETPIPCVACNRTVKFRDLLAVACDLGADALATGHYVRREAGPDGTRLYRAADESRDQSYFLFATTRAQLDFLRFPLGGLGKDAVREAAARLGLAIADKPDSQDICFVPQGHYGDVVEKLRPGAVRPGEIVHLDGTVLGTHRGIIHFTVGQRRGLDIGGREGVGKGRESEPLYVVRLDAAAARVIVGPKSALGRQIVHVGEVNWLDAAPLTAAPRQVAVKLRAGHGPVPASITARANGGAEIVLDTPAHGIAPGQAAVVYDGARVLGGGWILREGAAEQGNSAFHAGAA